MPAEARAQFTGGAGRTPVPAGWVDEAPGWPDMLPAVQYGFATPMAAVDALEDAFDSGDMHASMRALMALYILDTEMGLRAATYGRMARAVGKHVAQRPGLLQAGMIGAKLRYLAEDLGDSGNSAREKEARAFQGVLEAAGRG